MASIERHKITITIDWSSLERDVTDKAARMALLSRLSASSEETGELLESELSLQDSDMDLLKRAMTQAFAEVVTMCREYMWGRSHASDNGIISDDTITLTLMMPPSWNLAGTESIGAMIHAYVVAKAMQEWYRYTAPSRWSEQQAEALLVRSEIGKILRARVRGVSSSKKKVTIIE